MIRWTSFRDNNEGEKNVEVNEKQPSPAAIISPVLEEKSVMDCDDVQSSYLGVWRGTSRRRSHC